MSTSVNIFAQSKYEVDDCVICQKRTDDKPRSSEIGREKIWSAALLRKDVVYTRLKTLANRSTFKYHKTHRCYDSYIKISKFNVENLYENVPETSFVNSNVNDNSYDQHMDVVESFSNARARITRSQHSLHKTPTKTNKMIEIECILCDRIKDNNVIQKSRISEPEKANNFLEMTQYFNDKTYSKIAHLQTAESIIQANIYYHANCMRDYEFKYKKKLQAQNKQLSNARMQIDTSSDTEFPVEFEGNHSAVNPINVPKSIDEFKVTQDYIHSIEHRIIAGEVFELSSLTAAIKLKYNFNETFNNRFVKNILVEHFGEEISFSYPRQKNKSAIIFYSKLSLSEIISNIHSTSTIKNCALLLREVMKKIDFGLKNKYCDEYDLRTAWNNYKLPNEFIEFFSEFFNIEASRLKDQPSEEKEKENVDIKALKIDSLFQTMHYILTDGRGRTPLHVAAGLSVHHTSKSKTIVTNMNRLGHSISYSEVERYKAGLASYAAQSAELITPLPSHFDSYIFTRAAFYNFDHESGSSISGKTGRHDTFSVLFQEKSSVVKSKPDISNRNDHSMRSLNHTLKCQIKRNFPSKLPKNIYLPSNYIASTQEDIIGPESYRRTIESDDFAWYLSRMNLSDLSDKFSLPCNEKQSVPNYSAFHSLLGNDERPCDNVGFPPYLPHPVTEADTVYTQLWNFNEILSQLDQNYLPVTCDESVYKLARVIKFLYDKEFEKLFIELGDFHGEKVDYNCAGTYSDGSGLDHVMVETGIFGKNVIEQVLNGVYYMRSYKCWFIISEAFTRLQFKAFFAKHGVEKYENELDLLMNLQNTMIEGAVDEAKNLLQSFINQSQNLRNDFQEFVQQRSAESPLFKYGNNLLIMLDIAHSKHKANRNGNWELRVDTLKKEQPLYFALDRIHYARYGPVHLEDCLNLKRDMPEVYDNFIKGKFTVKHTSKQFSSVAIDQALEQTVNRSAKGPSEVIGVTNKENAVASWNMIFHEMVGIYKVYQEMLGLDTDVDELEVHHEFRLSNTQFMEESVNAVVKYLSSHVNPFQEGRQPLRNLVTGQLVDEKAAEKILNVFEIGCEKFNRFRQERIVKKEIPLSATLHRTKLPNFKTITKEVIKKKAAQKKDLVHQSARIVDIARVRKYGIDKLLSYEITPLNTLFDENGMIKKEKKKCELTQTLQKYLHADDRIIKRSPTAVVVDVMIYCYKVPWKNLKVFADFAIIFKKIVDFNIIHNDSIKRIDFVFDDYFELSPKTSERIRRSTADFIDQYEITSDTVIPSEAEFWPSEKNKEMLQLFLRNYFLLNGNELWPGKELVFSTISSSECISTIAHMKKDQGMSNLQRFDIEEADIKLMVHIKDCCLEGVQNILLLSSDTDIVALALNFWNTFATHGLQELWIQLVKENLPIHTLANKIGLEKCNTIVAAHHLTGADYTSKVGTKLSSLNTSPEKYLLHFGRSFSKNLVEYSIQEAELYLLNVLSPGTPCRTFNQLRYQEYHHSLHKIELHKLPATSASIRLHILRAYYVTYQQVNCLEQNITSLDPLEHGYEIQKDLLVPQKIQILLPPIDEFVPSCHCKACISEKSCICVRAGIGCCEFCSCQLNKTCKNKHNESVEVDNSMSLDTSDD